MLTLSSSLVSRYEVLKIIAVASAAWVLGTAAFPAAGHERVTVRLIGPLTSVIGDRIRGQVRPAPFTLQHDSPILLQGKTTSTLMPMYKQELKATYRAGYTIVLLDATMEDLSALHQIVGDGMNYRSKNSGLVLAYTLRKENDVPTATLVANVDSSNVDSSNAHRRNEHRRNEHRGPPRTRSDDPDPVSLPDPTTGLLDDELAFSRAADHTATELRRKPKLRVPGPPRDPNQQIAWQDNPMQTTTFVLPKRGAFNTPISVYALHACQPDIQTGRQLDHYVITAGSNWLASNAEWFSATSAQDQIHLVDGRLQVDWQKTRDFCSSPGFFHTFQDICGYFEYPLSYHLEMVPRPQAGTVVQTDAQPGATQGEQTTYSSGFSFSISGLVNVTAMGPGGGISVGASWNNTTQTTVPPLIVESGNMGPDSTGAFWNFKYCTTGLEPDSGTDCTSHVQMVKDVCQAQLGDNSPGTNPQLGQTPTGRLSGSIQSVHWTGDPATRVGQTFDIEVTFQANLATTIAHLSSPYSHPDPDHGCNAAGCACVSQTTNIPDTESFTFQIPFPSTICK